MTNYLIVALILLAGAGWSIALVLLIQRAGIEHRAEQDADLPPRKPTHLNRVNPEA